MSDYCCRLNQECIMAIVRNRSGIDSGEIDYIIKGARFDSQNIKSMFEIISTLKELINRCQDRIDEMHKESANE